MNTIGLNIILKMGCICSKQTLIINSKKYYIREHLGEGGFSTVDLIEDAMTGKYYAVKKIICHGIDDMKVAMKEIEYHEALKHPNIIRCIDSAKYGQPDPVLNSTSEVLLVLPYYQRGTLAHELALRSSTNNHMLPIDILHMFIRICEGVRAFHEATPEPLAHRDLKTANILLSNDNMPIIMDLGSVAVARVKICGSSEAQQLQDMASERCSMPYRAPELFNVESYCMIDERTDIWDMHDLILYMLKVNPMERPYIYSVIEKTHDVISKLEARA
ncbi:serine/threonine-protein kinase 16 isoform X2 [Anabrus simplex]|uniref:serine/threonine-protein kinase 16 isoform X2 n=1 Tax=Anabrus simplex TaxID=316456 RepID=UPI0035A30D22